MKKYFITMVILLLAFTAFAEGSFINEEDSPVQFFLETEFGALAVNYHTIRIGEEGTASNFDFVNEGGQELLFPFQRFNAGMIIADHHRISLLYQPLQIDTEVTFKEDVTIDGVTFDAGTAMELSYGFPFYRITYGFDFFQEDNIDLGVGAALQLRNASIVFKALDGSEMTVSQNLGPVPALYLFGKYSFDSGFYLLTDITGLYASSSFINGASFDFEGSILDASLRAGYTLKNDVDLFLNVRFLGGTASGVSEYPDLHWTDSTEDETANYLATTSITLGITIR